MNQSDLVSHALKPELGVGEIIEFRPAERVEQVDENTKKVTTIPNFWAKVQFKGQPVMFCKTEELVVSG